MAPGLLRVGALALRASSTICPVNPACPNDDSCSFTSNEVTLAVSCATDFYGGDLQLAQVSLGLREDQLKLTTIDINAGRLLEGLCYYNWMCGCKLRRRKLLHEEHAQQRSDKVSYPRSQRWLSD